jgi:hypothetical protein
LPALSQSAALSFLMSTLLQEGGFRPSRVAVISARQEALRASMNAAWLAKEWSGK